ncbi:elongation factor P [Fodinibius halophilus]|uniref:Elongation factor P n=1 Tax=Fodinibius halophilus TaxID=1736908 RepID=A0A6M1SWE1_9BACT|nr:elongation factor P [Fodinibius halophilus]NGP87876.1 elongation factor P [Fodinibius halophilus]
MAKVSTSNFRTGMVIKIDNELYSVVDYQHVKPGKGGAFLRTKLKGVVSDKNIEKKFRSGEDVEEVRVEHQPYQFLYRDGNLYYFMHQETYEQIPVEEENINKAEFIAEGQVCTLVVDVDNEKILYAHPPDQLIAKVADTRPGLKGDTAQGGSKPATLESGATIQVPLFIDEGEEIKVDTRTSEYIERVTSN